jgi:hypothetical protein
MSRKKRGARRHGGGRKFDPGAKRHRTTRVGRRTGQDPIDHGSLLLREKKLAATGRVNVETTASGILFGRGLLDRRQQYDVLGHVAALLRQVARGFGRDASPAALWSAIIAASSRTTPGLPSIIGDRGSRKALEKICRRLDGSRDLVLELAAEGSLPPICLRAIEKRLTPRDEAQLELLRKGLDGISPPRGAGFGEAS